MDGTRVEVIVGVDVGAGTGAAQAANKASRNEDERMVESILFMRKGRFGQ